ncbi:hypothetical protein TWF481_006305 [Arthrobotrys musiformis]|uniref:Uncharacterized protein n=1 Tax=Arthrobotrys musiformis TaxID=47236 RepID=A0AAV9WHN7_9PEZI
MKIWAAVAYCTLLSIFSTAPAAEAQTLPGRKNEINKMLLKDIEDSKFHIKGHVSVKFAKAKDGSIVLPETEVILPTLHMMETPVIHKATSSSSPANFSQAHWVYDKYYKPGGPVFLFLSGEADIQNFAGVFLNSSRLTDLLREFQGLGVVLQHRYYGLSTPKWALAPGSTELDRDTPVDRFRFLTTEQALLDTKYFAENFEFKSARVPSSDDLKPTRSPWVVLGGSYAGNMATFLRREYGDLFFAAYSSSAPAQAVNVMPAYWDVVSRAIADTEPACIKNVNSAIRYIDQELKKGGEDAARIMRMFLGPGGELNTRGWFAETLGYVFYGFQSNPLDEPVIDGTVYSIKHLCDHMNTDGDIVSPVRGWENATDPTIQKSGMWTATQWAKWPGFISFLQSSGYKCSGYGGSRATCSLAIASSQAEDLAWQWQVCYEWGFFQTGNSGPDQMMSTFSDLAHWKSKCALTFGNPYPDSVKGLALDKRPNPYFLNRAYGGWRDPQPRTFYTTGDKDPWSAQGFLQTRFLNEKLRIKSEYRPNPPFRANSTIPGCYYKPSGSESVFGYVVKDGKHATDIIGFRGSTETHPIFVSALKAWLPCFRQSKAFKTEAEKQNEALRGKLLSIILTTLGEPLLKNKTVLAKPAIPKAVNSTTHGQALLFNMTVVQRKHSLERRVKLWSDED